jgi:NADH-quinone oxidoreductase subunit M
VAADPLSRTAGLLIFGGMALGFAIKVPMFPFHTWLPDAHTQAPTAGSVILAAILLKLGSYGFMRIAIPILPDAATEYAPWIGGLAVIGIIYGALCCLAQTDMKRLIAFSSVSHMGFVMLGIATLTPAGFNAANFGMVAHGLITGMLFFIAGSVKDRWHTLSISSLGGVTKATPRLGWIFGLVSMASLGLPGLAGFWGEFPAILSAYEPAAGLDVGLFRAFMVIAAVGTVFAAGYLLWLYQRVALGNPAGEVADPHHHAHDIGLWEWVAWTPLIIGIIVLGLVPNLLFKVMNPAMEAALSAFGG